MTTVNRGENLDEFQTEFVKILLQRLKELIDNYSNLKGLDPALSDKRTLINNLPDLASILQGVTKQLLNNREDN